MNSERTEMRESLRRAGGSGKAPLRINNPDNPFKGLTDEQLQNIAQALRPKYGHYPMMPGMKPSSPAEIIMKHLN
jgi:hypothetical protein